ncbi:uncharacterized protein LOC117581881 [Drosophila guanche]|uniref:uncharacterized protein LOC117581881 n=1 Tax=Drosophila guanche TaxID=7266 RepID=UPI001470A6CA|nr:uncharacterized protein LOC117581881 [Drosophila guanche]
METKLSYDDSPASKRLAMGPSSDSEAQVSNKKDNPEQFCIYQRAKHTKTLELVLTEFTLLGIILPHLTARLVKRCQRRGINGYIITNFEGLQAFGVMEGSAKDIQHLKKWIETCCVPPRLTRRFVFSMSNEFKLARRQNYTSFEQRQER